MWLVMRRRWVVIAIAVVLVAAAVVIPTASSVGSSAPGNLVRAQAEAARLLGLLHVPSGAVERSNPPAYGGRGVLGAPGYDEATPNLVDDHHWWTVRGKAKQVLAYVIRRLPRGAKKLMSGSGGPRPVYYQKAFSLPPILGVLAERVLAVTVVQLNARTTAVRTDGEAVWITPRPASEKVPTGVQETDITSKAFMSGSPILAVKVTDRPQVQRIVSWINAMGIGQPGTINCPMLGGPTVTFVFRLAGGNEVARASGMDFDGTSGACNAIALNIRGRSEPPLIGGNFYKRVARLLGVRLGRSPMSSHRVTVLDALSANGIDGVVPRLVSWR